MIKVKSVRMWSNDWLTVEMAELAQEWLADFQDKLESECNGSHLREWKYSTDGGLYTGLVRLSKKGCLSIRIDKNGWED